MTDEQQGPQGPAGPPFGSTPADDEPTLETVAPAVQAATPEQDDEPTLETVEQSAAQADAVAAEEERMVGESTQEFVARRATGWGPRLEQMTAAKQERRRRVATRFWLTAAPVLIIVLVVVILLAVYGGQGGDGQVAVTTTAVVQSQVEGSGVLLVEKGGVLAWTVVLQPWDSGGVVLAVPGITLLQSDGAFATLADMYKTGRQEAVEAALGQALDVSLGPVVVVGWSALQTAAKSAGAGDLSAGAAGAGQGEAESMAIAVRTLVGEYASGGDSSPWSGMGLEGDTSQFMRALGLDQASMAENVWTTGALTGTTVQGDGFEYLEPDIEAAKELLAVTVQTDVVSVEVKDGAGIEGAPRRAGSLIESGGFVLAPMTYAQGYPGVEKTQILVAPVAAKKAQQVQTLLGLGEIVEDKTLTADRIVVILGKDFGGETP
jgi:hypothetical protein